ncbi:hypothetical protein D3C72_1886990 [compost metagenome]
MQEQQLAYQEQKFEVQRAAALVELDKHNVLLKFYEQSGLRQSEEIIRAATLSYRSGAISFAELSQFLSQAIGIRQNYLEALNLYNQAVIQINYYDNK